MTTQRNLKRLVRARMAQNPGQRYATARRAVLRELGSSSGDLAAEQGFVHLTGHHPEVTSLRVLLANAGVTAPHTGEAPSEALVFGIAGGVGTGVMSFRYEAEDFSSFWLTGWNPFQSSVTGACQRLGLTPTITETAGPATAARQLAELLAEGVPAMAWVDLATLAYAGLPPEWAGGSYHTVVVYSAAEAGPLLIGDRAPAPFEVDAERFAASRARIRKQRNRLLSLGTGELAPDLAEAARRGLAATAAGPVKGPGGGMDVDGLATWAARLHGSRAADSWSRRFPPGRHLWGALRSLVDFVEHQGSGGGLMRPMQAAFLREAAELTGDPRLGDLAGRYDDLARSWHELADAALPADVPELAATRELLARREALLLGPGAPVTGELEAAGAELDAVGERCAARFPLGQEDVDALLRGLRELVEELHTAEVAARGELRRLVPAAV